MSKKNILVIGGGVAAADAAAAARKADPDCQITVLSSEGELPIFRTRVAEVLRDKQMADKLFIHPASWYEERAIDFRLHSTAESIDPKKKTVRLDSGEEFPYDRLILANGSSSFVPPVEGFSPDFAYTLWNLKDAVRLSDAIDEKPIRRIAIIGGGLLGLEAAWQLRQRGLEVVMLERGSGLLTRQLDTRASEILKAAIEKEDVEVVLDADTKSFETKKDAPYHVTLHLADGRTVEADAVLFAVGVRANTPLAESAGLEIGRRIKVNEKMESSEEAIYAAGDVCEVNPDGYWFGLFPISREQGSVAGNQAAGGSEVFEKRIPPYQASAMGTRIVSQGKHPDKEEDGLRFEIEEDPASNSYKKLVFKGDQLVGYILLGEAVRERQELDKRMA